MGDVTATWENEGVISADLKLDRTRLPEAGDGEGDAPVTAGDDEDDEDDGAAGSDAAPGL